MRVIAGSAKGRPLKSALGNNTRPTTDKVKEALFSMITPYLDGGTVLDLFAGTGGLGIEALSRGMEFAVFIDQNKNSIDIIKDNIEFCGFTDRVEIYRNDAERALRILSKRGIKFDLIFLDPPYKLENYLRIISFIAENEMMSEEGIIVAEHDAKYFLPENIKSFSRIKSALYGNIGLTIYQIS